MEPSRLRRWIRLGLVGAFLAGAAALAGFLIERHRGGDPAAGARNALLVLLVAYGILDWLRGAILKVKIVVALARLSRPRGGIIGALVGMGWTVGEFATDPRRAEDPAGMVAFLIAAMAGVWYLIGGVLDASLSRGRWIGSAIGATVVAGVAVALVFAGEFPGSPIRTGLQGAWMLALGLSVGALVEGIARHDLGEPGPIV